MKLYTTLSLLTLHEAYKETRYYTPRVTQILLFFFPSTERNSRLSPVAMLFMAHDEDGVAGSNPVPLDAFLKIRSIRT